MREVLVLNKEGLQESLKEADLHGNAHASQTRARKVIPVKDMTSVRP